MTEEMFLFRGFTRLEQLKHLIATGQIGSDFTGVRSSPPAGKGLSE